MTRKHIFGGALVVGALLVPLVAAVQAQTATPQQPPAHHSQATSKQAQSEGERIFAQNCSRCHNAPDGFSPHISGTVIRHMRVRAQLSQHDEQELLRFLTQ